MPAVRHCHYNISKIAHKTMHLKTLELENFRNYKNLILDFEKDQVTVLVGDNAEGKTNLLESIYCLGLTKSFRSRKSFEQICWGREHSRIKGKVENLNGDQELEIFCAKTGNCKKVLKVNEGVVKSQDFIGNLNLVIFTPDDLNLISLSPGLRRRYLNMLISQVNKKHLKYLIEYSKIIRQRNALLLLIKQRKAQRGELEYWDRGLVDIGVKIFEDRERAIDFFNERLSEKYGKIAGKEEKLEMKYKSDVSIISTGYVSVISTGAKRSGEIPLYRSRPDTSRNLPDDNVRAAFAQKLSARISKDIDYVTTSVGPHLDDFSLYLDGRNIAEFGSRGEFRSAILSLKLTEIDYIKEVTGEYPLLLLDDVFSELDELRKEQFIKAIQNCQTLITTTKESANITDLLKSAKVHEIRRERG